MAQHTGARGRYIEIATRRMAEQGFHGTSLAALAKEAGVTKQALLHFFGTKERLYAEVLERLAERLSAKIDESAAATPEDRLIAYFDAHIIGGLARPADARLVIHALLDSDAAARVWPLKPYLEKLVALTLQTRRWQGASRAETLAGIYQLIGATQYFAISAPTLEGMFGAEPKAALEEAFVARARAATRAFVEGT